jgi:hypothetical protein
VFVRQPAAAVAPLEEAARIDPASRTVLGMLGYAYAAAGDLQAARRTRARLDLLPDGVGMDVAVARIAIGLGDTTLALARLERAARARDPFFSTEPMGTVVFDPVRSSARFLRLQRELGLAQVPAHAPAPGQAPAGSRAD